MMIQTVVYYLIWAFVGPTKAYGTMNCRSADAGVRSEGGVCTNTPVPQFSGLLQQRLSTACRYNSSTTRTRRYNSSTIRTAEGSCKYPVTQNAVGLVDLQLTKH